MLKFINNTIGNNNKLDTALVFIVLLFKILAIKKKVKTGLINHKFYDNIIFKPNFKKLTNYETTF